MQSKDLDNLDKEIINYIGNNSHSKSSVILKKISKKINQSTLTRRLDKLIKLNFISKKGEGRSTVYISDEISLFFSIDPDKRVPVDFDLNFIENLDVVDNDMFFNEKELK